MSRTTDLCAAIGCASNIHTSGVGPDLADELIAAVEDHESDEAALRTFGAVTIHDSYAKRPLRLDDVRTARRLLREARLTLGSLDRQIAELDEKRNKLRGLLAR